MAERKGYLQGSLSRTLGGPFAVINGAIAEDVICVHIPKGVELERPVHTIYATSGSSLDWIKNVTA